MLQPCLLLLVLNFPVNGVEPGLDGCLSLFQNRLGVVFGGEPGRRAGSEFEPQEPIVASSACLQPLDGSLNRATQQRLLLQLLQAGWSNPLLRLPPFREG